MSDKKHFVQCTVVVVDRQKIQLVIAEILREKGGWLKVKFQQNQFELCLLKTRTLDALFNDAWNFSQ